MASIALIRTKILPCQEVDFFLPTFSSAGTKKWKIRVSGEDCDSSL